MRNEGKSSPAPDYVQRVNRAIDHVVRHLSDPLPLEEVARVAGFSKFHFHRIFRAATGETLSRFVARLRLERAVALMVRGRARSLTEVALTCGFASSSDFSRSFRRRFGVPPSAFDSESFRATRRREFEAMVAAQESTPLLERLPPGQNPDGFTAELVTLPRRTVAYLRVPDPFRPDVVPAAAARLLAWAEARGVADGAWLGYMWDDPEIVAPADCRYDVGVVVEDVAPEGEIGRIAFPEMTVVQVEVRGALDLEQRAIDWIFGTWLPESGFVPGDQPFFEAWIGRPFAHGMEHFEILAQIPVVRPRGTSG